ncbi:MAG: SGNH/GDSL hydrolase family protein [Gammaproteobacteria bacterium]
MRMIKLLITLCFYTFLTGCAFVTSFNEDPDPWNPPVNSKPTVVKSVSTEPLSDEQIEAMVTSPDFTGFARKALLENGQRAQTATFKENVRIIIAGDSWAFFDVIYGATESKLKSINPAFNIEYLDYTTENEDTAFPHLLAIPGSKASQWQDNRNSQMIINALIRNRDASVLVVFLGGNDWIDTYKCYDNEGNKKRFNKIGKDIASMFSNIQEKVFKASPRRKLDIILVGYSKLNFVDSLDFNDNESRVEKFGFVKGKCKDGTKNPTRQINNGLAQLRDISKQHVLALNKPDEKPTVHFINNFDIFGKNINKPTHKDHMLYSYFKIDGIYKKYIFLDSIHLGKKAQHKVAEKIMEYILKNNLLE